MKLSGMYFRGGASGGLSVFIVCDMGPVALDCALYAEHGHCTLQFFSFGSAAFLFFIAVGTVSTHNATNNILEQRPN